MSCRYAAVSDYGLRQGTLSIGLVVIAYAAAENITSVETRQEATRMKPFDVNGNFHPTAEGKELRRLTVRGGAATISASALSLAVQVVSTVILARLLTPADFGVVAMVTTFVMFLMGVGANGCNEAIIQRDKVDRFLASNLFWINLAVGLILMVGFAAAGSLLAQFYKNPLVAHVTVAMSPGILIAAVSVVPLALLKRAMRFAAVSANDVIGRTVNTALTILLALRGWGYWALVAGIVAQALSIAIGAWWLCRWIPSLPRRGVGTRAVLRFAAHVYGTFNANYFTRNFDNLLVGWRFNAVALGYYKRAYDLFALSASQLTAPLNNVALAALSRVKNDPARFRRYFASSLEVIAMVGMAVGADLTLVGKDVVRLVLGSKWLESGRIFELFGPGIGVMLLYSTIGWIHVSIGKPERWFRWTLVESTATGALFLVALPWGPAGIAVAWSVSFWVLLIPAFWYAGRPIHFGVSQLLGATWKYALASLVAGWISTIALRRFAFLGIPGSVLYTLEEIIIISLVFLILYLGAVILLHRGFSPLHQLRSLLLELAPAKKQAKEPVAELYV
jgi:PST family polysaccharide transporter